MENGSSKHLINLHADQEKGVDPDVFPHFN